MQPDERDAGYLWDMVEAGRSIARFITGLTLATYLQDEVLQAAIERKLEIMGEAARKISQEFRNHHPEIPWAKIIAQRHVLAHDYGRIDHRRVWEVITVHVPAVVEELTRLLPGSKDDDS